MQLNVSKKLNTLLTILEQKSPNYTLAIADNTYLIDISGAYINNYNNKFCIQFLTQIFNNFKNIIDYTAINNYLYIYIMDVQIPKNKLAIKIGYTKNNIKRKKSLMDKYKCTLFQIACFEINGQYDEIELHNKLKYKYPKYVIPLTLSDGTITSETYYLEAELLREVVDYIKYLISKNQLNIEKEKTKQIEAVEKTKQEEQKTRQTEEQTKQAEEQTKQLQLQKEILLLKLQYNIT